MISETMEILMMTNSIFEVEERYREQVLDIAHGAALTIVNSNEVTLEMIEKAEIIFGWPQPEQIKQAKNLKWLHLPSAGADRYAHKEIYCNKEILLTKSQIFYKILIILTIV